MSLFAPEVRFRRQLRNLLPAAVSLFLAANSLASAADPPGPAAPDTDVEQDALEVQIIQALDQPVDLKVEDAPIRRALQQISDNAGIPVRLAPGTIAYLPYGSETRVSATVENRLLRECLVALLRPLGLEFRPTSDCLLIEPSGPLKRLGRRATWPELDTLHRLYSQPWSEALAGSLSIRFLDPGLAPGADPRAMLRAAAASVGAGSAAQVLDAACARHGWTWYPEEEGLVVISLARQIERQLETRVTLGYVQTSLGEAIMDLARRAGVLIRMDPGVLLDLPPQASEKFSLSIENASVRQALEVISAETGLRFVIEQDALRVLSDQRTARRSPDTAPAGESAVSLQSAAEAAAAAIMRANPIVGQFTYPLPDGSSFAFFVRQNDLPPEVDQLRQRKITAGINQLRRQLAAEAPQD